MKTIWVAPALSEREMRQLIMHKSDWTQVEFFGIPIVTSIPKSISWENSMIKFIESRENFKNACHMTGSVNVINSTSSFLR